ncbi:MAG: membrane dipeptidase [Myxococcota bacterium]|nr:membrane dipeptidase [Myxococcota bacterium]
MSLANPLTSKKRHCSAEAIQLCQESELIDLHIDTFIPPRLWGYDPLRRNKHWIFGRHFFGHLDVPRMQEGGVSGAMWSITTNPFRSARNRWRTFLHNLETMETMFQRSNGRLMRVRSVEEYHRARSQKAQACMISIQGGNAIEYATPKDIPDQSVTRITLIHLTHSCYGTSSTPTHFFRRHKGLTKRGKELVRQLNEERIFVDLAHIHPTGFWDAVDAHDKHLPLIDTHTGVCGTRKHWRNIDDRQIKAIADSGGVVGIIFAANYIQRRGGPKTADMIVEHIEHTINLGGEDCVALGSDFDGLITPPLELASGDAYPVLVQRMLDRKWSTSRIKKVLGSNFLQCWSRLRPKL